MALVCAGLLSSLGEVDQGIPGKRNEITWFTFRIKGFLRLQQRTVGKRGEEENAGR